MVLMRRKSKKPEWQLKIAEERIEILFGLAREELEKHPERSRRYVESARKIGTRYNIRFPKELKRSFCKKCNTLLTTKTSEEIESHLPNLRLIKCLNCEEIKKCPKMNNIFN